MLYNNLLFCVKSHVEHYGLLVLPNTINNANKRLNANLKGIIVPSVV